MKPSKLSRNDRNDLILTVSESGGEAAVGIVMIILGLITRFIIIPRQIRVLNPGFPDPRSLPEFYSLLIAAMGLGIAITAYRNRKKRYNVRQYKFNLTGIARMAIIYVIMWIETVLLYKVPYIPATALMLIAMMLVLKQKNKFVLIGVAIVMPLLVWLLFTYGLKLVMP